VSNRKGNSMNQRKVIRLQESEYCKNGYYFITIRTYRKICLYGDIIDGIIQNNIAGKMIEKWYLKNGIKIYKYQMS